MTRLLAPARPAPADLAIRLAAKDRGWLERVKHGAPAVLPTSVWQTIASAYTTPGRHYHTLEHLAELADRYAEVQAGPGWQDPGAVWLALLFHDVVYTVDPSQAPGENERRSAAMLLALVPGAFAAAELVRATANHNELPPLEHADPHDLIHFLDADLSILGASPTRFARYSRQVAAEYVPVVGRDLYEAGRGAFRQRMCEAPTLFHSPWFRARYEAAARKNLGAAADKRR